MAESFEHAGHTVSLTSNFRFAVSGPAFDGDVADTFDSAQAARDRIDARVKVLEKQNRTRAQMSIAAIDDMGESCTIRGIHMNTRELLGVPKATGRHGLIYGQTRNVFPPLPWLVAEIKRWRQLQDDTKAIELKLAHYIQAGELRGYGKIDADNYDAIVASFEQQWAALVKKAEADTPEIAVIDIRI